MKAAAAAETAALPGYCTVSVTVAEWLSEPLAPVIVSVNVPVPVFLFVEIVSMEFPDPATGFTLKLALLRAGSPVTLSVTLELNPFNALIVTV